jgi:ankyrin repeat protein
MDYIRHYINKQDVEGLNLEIQKWGITLEMCHHALTHAAKCGHLFFVKYFLNYGADPRFLEDSPVLYACENGHIEVVKFLVSLGANVRMKDDTTLRRSAQNGHIEVVKYLCEAGADIHLYNNSAVTWASWNGHIEVVMYLYERGADISNITYDHEKCISFCEKMKQNIRHRAQKKIYFWWIPICYDITRNCGKRMMEKNLDKAKELGLF